MQLDIVAEKESKKASDMMKKLRMNITQRLTRNQGLETHPQLQPL